MSTIPFSDVLDWQPLPIDAQDIVTKVRLVVAGNRAGREPGALTARDPATFPLHTAIDYAPMPIVYTYEAPEHAIYGATRSFELPAGMDPFLPPTDPAIPEPTFAQNFDNPGSPSAVKDGDPTTYAENTGGYDEVAQMHYLAVPDAVGFRLRYWLDAASGWERSYAEITVLDAVTSQGTVQMRTGPLPNTTDPAELYVVLPPDAHWALDNGGGSLDDAFGVSASIQFQKFPMTNCRLHAFYPLVLNRALLEDVARAQIRLPAQTPRRVTVAGTLPPGEMEHTITGWPGGTYTGQVARQTYRGGETVVDFEQAGAPPGVPQEALEAERVRVARTRQVVNSAGYGLKMGERQ